MRRARDPITELRRAIDLLPEDTRIAMLDGIRGGDNIIVGAYTDSSGGMCPMLAAHRNGSRSAALAFARSWDGFAGSRRARRASRRELTILETQLTESLGADPGPSDLRAAIADHVALKQRALEPEPVKPAPAPEEQIRAWRLGGGGGIGRLRPRRSDADAERVLARLEEHVLAATR